jgi:hypothetical protein
LRQRVFAREVPVERELGHARVGDHAVDAGGAYALLVEEVVGGEQDAVARRVRDHLSGGCLGHAAIVVRQVDRSVYLG